MTKHIVNSYDKELHILTESILNMGYLVKEMVLIANKSLQETGSDYTDIANKTDNKINLLDLQIEQQAINILALRQPMAIDLRQVISALKLAVIMERMGDLAKNTCKRAVKITTRSEPFILSDIALMSQVITSMIEDVLEAFKRNDDQQTSSIKERDVQVDQIYFSLMNNLEQEMIKRSNDIPSINQMTFAIKNIERIGDYVTKVAGILHFIITGERVIKQNKYDNFSS